MGIQTKPKVRNSWFKLKNKDGNTRDREFDISYKQVLRAAEQGKKWAIAELAAYAEYQQDYPSAIKHYQKLAIHDNQANHDYLHYMCRIAVIYEQSLEDIDNAIDWYSEAGHYGDQFSMIRAGYLLEFYFEDYDEAVAWYRKAAQQNNLRAISHLCRIYMHCYRDFDMAIEWYKRAVQLGDLGSAIALGQFYENTQKDYPKAIEWYSLAAKSKSLYAINLLCQLYEVKLQDYPKAIEWYKQAIAFYNQQNGAEVIATDPQGQHSIDTTQTDRMHGEPNTVIDTDAYPVDQKSQTNPVASQAVTKEYFATPQYAQPTQPFQVDEFQVDEFMDEFDEALLSNDEALLSNPKDLHPTEIVHKSPKHLHSDAEVEFLS